MDHAPMFATFTFNDGTQERHQMTRSGDSWVPKKSLRPLEQAAKVVLDDGTVIKDRFGPESARR